MLIDPFRFSDPSIFEGQDVAQLFNVHVANGPPTFKGQLVPMLYAVQLGSEGYPSFVGQAVPIQFAVQVGSEGYPTFKGQPSAPPYAVELSRDAPNPGVGGEPNDWANVMLLIHGDTRPFLDVSESQRLVANYCGVATLSGGAVALPAVNAGLRVQHTNGWANFAASSAWMISAKVKVTSTSVGGVKARIFDSRTAVGAANGIVCTISGTTNAPVLQINNVTYGIANLALTDGVESTVSWCHDGSRLRCFVDGAASWEQPAGGVAVAAGNASVVTIGNTPDMLNGIAGVTIRELMVVSGEPVYMFPHTAVTRWSDTGIGIEAHPNPASYASVKLNLHGSSMANLSTAFVDTSATPKTLTANGNVKANTALARIGTSSILFDGTGDFISTPNNADFNFLTGDFSIEYQLYNGGGAGDEHISNYQNASNGWSLYNGNANHLSFNATGDGGDCGSGDNMIPTSVWRHCVTGRYNGVVFMSIEGEMVNFTPLAVNITSTQALNIGRLPGFTTLDLLGSMQEIRIIKGECPFRRSFTPRTDAHPDA